jgi:hypothetical protein
MLDLRPASETLAKHHERFLDETLPEGLRAADFEAFDRSAYPEAVLDIGRRAWSMRALDEYRSLAAFTELLAALSQLGVAVDLLGVGARVVRDEDRHVALCGRMVEALGGTAVLEGEPAWVRGAEGGPRTFALSVIVGSLCIGETFSMRVLAAMRAHTIDPLAKRLVDQFAADESVHSRYGWACLEVLTPHLSEREKARIEGWIETSLKASRTAMRPRGDGKKGPMHPFGSIDDEVRVEVFDKALAEIETRFTDLGFAVPE